MRLRAIAAAMLMGLAGCASEPKGPSVVFLDIEEARQAAGLGILPTDDAGIRALFDESEAAGRAALEAENHFLDHASEMTPEQAQTEILQAYELKAKSDALTTAHKSESDAFQRSRLLDLIDETRLLLAGSEQTRSVERLIVHGEHLAERRILVINEAFDIGQQAGAAIAGGQKGSLSLPDRDAVIKYVREDTLRERFPANWTPPPDSYGHIQRHTVRRWHEERETHKGKIEPLLLKLAAAQAQQDQEVIDQVSSELQFHHARIDLLTRQIDEDAEEREKRGQRRLAESLRKFLQDNPVFTRGADIIILQKLADGVTGAPTASPIDPEFDVTDIVAEGFKAHLAEAE